MPLTPLTSLHVEESESEESDDIIQRTQRSVLKNICSEWKSNWLEI
jgi:hypothetical protein